MAENAKMKEQDTPEFQKVVRFFLDNDKGREQSQKPKPSEPRKTSPAEKKEGGRSRPKGRVTQY